MFVQKSLSTDLTLGETLNNQIGTCTGRARLLNHFSTVTHHGAAIMLQVLKSPALAGLISLV